MAIDTQTLERIELDLETAHGQLMPGLVSPAVSEDTKVLAAAIVLAGSDIALALASAESGDGS